MKNNYPIKYAVMPIIKSTGWCLAFDEEERKYGTVCYIVSKCYLLGKEENYNMYGDTYRKYKVVFPYTKDNRYGFYLSRVEPSSNFYGRPNNSIDVDNVFDSFDEAKEDAEKKNEEILSRELSYVVVDDDFFQNVSLVKVKREEIVNYYQKIESLIEENSTDLVVNNQIKEQSIIFGRGNSYKKKRTLYHMLNLYSDENFIAYNVSLDDYKKIEEQLKNGQEVDTDSIKKNCLLISSSSDKKVKVVNYDSKDKRSCFYIENGSLYYDDNIDTSLDTISDDAFVIYTMETYDDVINSYIANYVMNWDIPKNKDTEKVFRKSIKLK